MRAAERISDALDLLPDETIREAEEMRRRPVWWKRAAIAACLCLAILALTLFYPTGSGNSFAVKAYALAEEDDGTIGLCEVDLLDQPDVWGGHYDSETATFYVSVGLRYEGENIESVTFTTEEGFFAKQYINKLSGEKHVTKMYVGAENRLVMYGTEFEPAGEKVTLSDETMTEDLLLFWGTQAENFHEVPKSIPIHAKALFRDGETQEITISIDLTGPGVGTFMLEEEELLQAEREKAYYEALPLDQCELVEESVMVVTDVYEVKLPSNTSWIEIRDDMEFDEDGVYRAGIRGVPDADGYAVYLPVIRRSEDGTYTGMVYRVPEDLQYQK